MALDSRDHTDGCATDACAQTNAADTFEWIEPPAPAPRSARTRWLRTGLAAACVLATLAALLVTQMRAGQTAAPAPLERGAITLRTNVPWAQAVVDDYTQPAVLSGNLGMPRELATRQPPHEAPRLSISTAPGRHVVSLTAEGFAARRVTVTVVRDGAVTVQLPLAPTVAGRAAMLAAVDDLLGSMRASVDPASGAPWLAALGLRRSTAPANVDVGVRFHAVALDPHDPLFVTPDAAGGRAPAPGTLGVAVLVSAQISATDPRTGHVLAQRTVLLGVHDAVWASVWYDDGRWVASDPYLRGSDRPVTPQTLLAGSDIASTAQA